MKHLFSILMLVSSIIAQNHILITEIVVTPTAGEFVEIYNNTGSTIDLTDYYMTDGTNASGNEYYYKIVTGANAGGENIYDFHVRFPAGSSIAAGEFQSIAINGANFVNTYGVQPTYEIFNSDAAIPDMLEAYTTTIGIQSGLSNAGEVIILYYWNGLSDLVQDVDYVVWGDKNEAVDKTGISIDGPDPGTTQTTYLNDTSIGQQISVSSANPHVIGKSVQRLDMIENSETQSGGNGITGHDETSEDLASSFQVDDPNPGTGPFSSNAPVITNITQVPTTPSPTDTVFITADVTDNGTLLSVKMFASINSAQFDSTDMVLQSGNTYISFFLPQVNGTQIDYYIKAEDNEGNSSTTSIFNFTVMSGTAPIILNITQVPPTPSPTDTVFITADVTDDGTLVSVKLFTSINSSPFDSTDMIFQSGNTYESYVLPQTNGYQVDYYIKAEDNDSLISNSSTFNYYITSSGGITPIADIQNNPGYIGQQVNIEGVVTQGAGITSISWTDAYVQDSSGRGINIYLSGAIDPDLVRHNKVQITGTVEEYSGVTEILNYSVQVIATNQPLPDSLNLSTSGANNLIYEGTLIYVQGAIVDKFIAGPGTTIKLDDGSGVVDIRAWDSANLNLSAYNIGDTVGIKGVMDIYQGSAQLLLAYQEDINSLNVQNVAPQISNIVRSPLYPASSDTTIITADVTDNGTVVSVKLFKSINSAPFDSSNMSLSTGYSYRVIILPQADSTQVQYYIKAKDDEGLISTTGIFSYLVSSSGHLDLRVATYNILNYSGSDRNSYFTTVTQAIDADIIIVQEMLNQTGVDIFNSIVLNNQYSTISFHNGYDTDNHLFYRADKLQFISDNYLSTALRDIAEYKMRELSNNEIIYFYSAHLKASSGSTNELLRLAEATILRNHLNNHPPNTNFMFVGDLNLYYSGEPAYHKLIGSEPDNDGRLFDVVDSTGYWHNNNNYANIHTQSPRSEQFGGGASGGLDDRFDFILVSNSLLDNIITSSYTEYGNDGQHFNQSINNGTNGAVGPNIADALYYGSDHLPVYCDFVFESANGVPESDTEKPESFIFFQNYPNPFNPLTTIKYSLTEGKHITIEVFNNLGQKIETLVKAWQGIGNHEVHFNAYELPSGVYFYRIQTNDFIQVKKMILMK